MMTSCLSHHRPRNVCPWQAPRQSHASHRLRRRWWPRSAEHGHSNRSQPQKGGDPHRCQGHGSQRRRRHPAQRWAAVWPGLSSRRVTLLWWLSTLLACRCLLTTSRYACPALLFAGARAARRLAQTSPKLQQSWAWQSEVQAWSACRPHMQVPARCWGWKQQGRSCRLGKVPTDSRLETG